MGRGSEEGERTQRRYVGMKGETGRGERERETEKGESDIYIYIYIYI